MYGGLGMSAPSLHRESTDSLINILLMYRVPSIIIFSFTELVGRLCFTEPDCNTNGAVFLAPNLDVCCNSPEGLSFSDFGDCFNC